jgi:hypoxanthine phosphoribosyltransferase
MPKNEQEHLRILIRDSAIQRRTREMGRQISRDFRGQRVHLIGVLKGASIFLSDLIRNIRLEASLDFIAVSSYGKAKESSGQVRLTKDLDTSIEGLNVILVEDILDTGLTLTYLQRVLMQRRPRILRIAALLDKVERRIKDVRADYVGFRIPNEFVVGYGLDYAERYRNLRDVCVLSLPGEPEIDGKASKPLAGRLRRSAASAHKATSVKSVPAAPERPALQPGDRIDRAAGARHAKEQR